jgi:hypothetical protein
MPTQAEKLADFKSCKQLANFKELQQKFKTESDTILRMRPVKNVPITETDESSNVHSGIYLLPH